MVVPVFVPRFWMHGCADIPNHPYYHLYIYICKSIRILKHVYVFLASVLICFIYNKTTTLAEARENYSEYIAYDIVGRLKRQPSNTRLV